MPAADSGATALPELTIISQRLKLLGSAQTASDGVVSREELELSPAYRPGQLLETVPGLIVTAHSGEGKANQYLMRGYNLDHGTDLAVSLDGVPINQPTHTHGQGFTDLNLLIPELMGGLSYTKGTYHADVGDFGGVGSVRLDYLDTIQDQASVTTGMFNFQRLFVGGTHAAGDGNLLMALELQHYDGPFVVPDDQRKENLVLRYSEDDGDRRQSLTGSFYHGLSTSTTDIPERAIDEGVVPNRFGSLDPTDGVNASRGILSYQYEQSIGRGRISANAYYSHNELHLYNNFTHDLVDTVHGDQEGQFESRNTEGGETRFSLPLNVLSTQHELLIGALFRADQLELGRKPSMNRVLLSPAQTPDDPPSFSDADRVRLLSAAAYWQLKSRWTSWFRSVLGFRNDDARGSDDDRLAVLHESSSSPYTNAGHASRDLSQPKGSLIFTPDEHAEFYLSAGRGFHSADIRGVNQTRSLDLNLPGSPLLASQIGKELGLRAVISKQLSFTVALYELDQQSETTINPDVGSDVSGPPSRRSGYEINITDKVQRWLEFYASFSGDRTRFRQPFDDGTGHQGTHIADAPVATGSLALYLQNLGPWSGGVEYRYLGHYPLASGNCDDSAVARDFSHSFADGQPATCANAVAKGLTTAGETGSKGFGELNLDLHYAFRDGWSISALGYNLLDSRRNAAEFTYVDRLQSEVTDYPDGRADTHIHPLESIAARLTLSKKFAP